MKPNETQPSATEASVSEAPSTTKVPMTEEEFAAQYRQLPLWQHVLLVLLFLFGLAAVILVIDYAVETVTEILKHIL